MKGKFSSMWRVAVALALVLSLSLVMAAPAVATVSQPKVTVAPADPTTAADYTIKFTTSKDLASGDGIVVEFPTGTTGLGNVGTGDVTGATVASVANVGKRLSMTLGADLKAGDITLVIGNTKVTNPSDGDYTLKVYTSQEPTAVTSETYMISKALTSVGDPNLTPATVNTASTYDLTFTTSAELRPSDSIIFEFPEDTDISAVVKEDVTVTDVGDGTTDVDSISIDGQKLTITLGGTLAAGETKVTIANHIINPTTLLNQDPDSAGVWKLTVYTSYKDRIPTKSGAYTLSEGSAVSKIAWSTVDQYVPNDTPSTAFKIQTQDQYGNAATVTENTTFDLTTSSGAFYSDEGCTSGNVKETVTIEAGHSEPELPFYYKGATAGTVTITADEHVSQDWTKAETTILVNPKLELWGGGELKASYATFADAMGAAVPYDTIKVAASTYDAFTVNKPYLTIESTASKDSTFIVGEITLDDGANSFVLGGASGKGFSLKGGDTADFVIMLRDPSNVEISYNKIDTTTTNTICDGIRLWGNATVSGLTVKQNAFIIYDQYDMGVRGHVGSKAAGLTIKDSTFTGTDNTLETSAIEINWLDISSTDTTISGNTMTSVGNAMCIGDWTGSSNGGLVCGSGGTGKKLIISSNTAEDCKYGIDLVNAAATGTDQNVVIKLNTFTNNSYGLAIDYGSIPLETDNLEPGDFTVKYNDFSGNTYGVYNHKTEAVVAQHNWWGDKTGPSTDPNAETATAYGAGDPISDKVTYVPWLAVSQSVCVPATSSQYAIEIRLTNVASYSGGTWSSGWNTFSTPVYLDGSANTWNEIVALVDLQYVTAYAWDGTNWVTVSNFGDDTLYPLDALFVQMKEEASLPILFGTQLLPAPTKEMHAAAGDYTGWELIGPAKVPDPGTMTITTELVSISTKYSQVINPISGEVLDGTEGEVANGQGYWVFMTSDGTLAGYTVTPQPFVPVP